MLPYIITCHHLYQILSDYIFLYFFTFFLPRLAAPSTLNPLPSTLNSNTHTSFLILSTIQKSPKEMPSSEHRFTESLRWIGTDEPHVAFNFQEVLGANGVIGQPGKMSEVAPFDDFLQEQLPTPLISRHNIKLLLQSKHLMQHPHHRPCKLV